MNQAQQIQYLANIYFLAYSDKSLDIKEDTALENIAKEIGGGYLETRKALDISILPEFKIVLPERLSDRIRNIEDMILVALCDNRLETIEKKIVTQFAKDVDITKEQFKMIKNFAATRIKTEKLDTY